MAGRSRPNRLAAKSLPAKGESLRTQQGRGLDKRQAGRQQAQAQRQGRRRWLTWVRDFVIGLVICAALVSWWIGQRHPEPPVPNNPTDLRDLAATLPPPLQSLADNPPPSSPHANPLPPSLAIMPSTEKPHFPVQDIVVTGTHYLGQAEVVANLPFEKGDAMGRINLQLAANKIKQLPWVRQVHLRRDWVRQQVVVDIQEWQPVALLQQQGRVKLMNAEGMVLNAPLTPAFQQFILLVGNGASKQWSQLDHLLASQPMLRERMKTASWVGNRRWDLQLDNGVTIKLPELDPTAALAKFVSLDKRGQDSPAQLSRLSPPITTVDLRLPDRVTLRGLPAGKPKLPAPKQFDKTNKAKQPHTNPNQPHNPPLSARERET